ncbi:MAG: hypothetical protein QGH20_04610 [Candidatus Latescibacteria bacterium]|nr:hypothetical protein [Candidatus Latescibacterota bacterium]
MSIPLSGQQISLFREKGYTIAPGFFTESEIGAMKGELGRLLAAKKLRKKELAEAVDAAIEKWDEEINVQVGIGEFGPEGGVPLGCRQHLLRQRRSRNVRPYRAGEYGEWSKRSNNHCEAEPLLALQDWEPRRRDVPPSCRGFTRGRRQL